MNLYLLDSTLQVDVAFSPAREFRAIGPTFRLRFGDAADARPAPEPSVADLIGMGWLYALHARSSIERGRVWQAEYMLLTMLTLFVGAIAAAFNAGIIAGVGHLRRIPQPT